MAAATKLEPKIAGGFLLCIALPRPASGSQHVHPDGKRKKDVSRSVLESLPSKELSGLAGRSSMSCMLHSSGDSTSAGALCDTVAVAPAN